MMHCRSYYADAQNTDKRPYKIAIQYIEKWNVCRNDFGQIKCRFLKDGVCRNHNSFWDPKNRIFFREPLTGGIPFQEALETLCNNVQ
ncbi:hypothetical protein FKM82_014545 [Ascaphus truei]